MKKSIKRQRVRLHVGSEVTSNRPLFYNDDVAGRAPGVIVTVLGRRAMVRFTIPRYPTVCERCGQVDGLVASLVTGEIICGRKQCNHWHGFEDITMSVPLSMLILYDEFRAEEAARLKQAKREFAEMTRHSRPLTLGKRLKWRPH